MRLSLVRSWVEERKLRIFDNVVIVIVLATLVISLAAVFAALALPGTQVFVSLIFFSVQFHNNTRRPACRLNPKASTATRAVDGITF
jgi:hypothetical protein